jgi:murein DD-endopeptidase MepM/ murein hydrolase activator NlpD
MTNQGSSKNGQFKNEKMRKALISLVIASAIILFTCQTIQAQGIPPTSETDIPNPQSTPSISTIEDVDGDPLPTMVFPTPTVMPDEKWSPPLSSMPLALSQYDHFYLSRPIAVDSVNWPMPQYLYGYEDSETDNPHSGLDYDAPLHTPILAAASGKVVFAGYGLALGKGNSSDPYGLAVVIRHDFSYSGYSILTVYSHMEKVLVSAGDFVKEGTKIGLVGMTGNTSGPHVHFEVRLEKDNIYYVQNPELWVMPNIDYGVFVGKFTNDYGQYLLSKKITIEALSSGKKWNIYTYAALDVPNDPNYQENVTLGDLPAGKYRVTFLNNYEYFTYDFSISPGAITYVEFVSKKGFSAGIPEPAEAGSFSPQKSH